MNWFDFIWKAPSKKMKVPACLGKLPSDAIKAEKSNFDNKLDIDKLSLILLLKNLFEKCAWSHDPSAIFCLVMQVVGPRH